MDATADRRTMLGRPTAAMLAAATVALGLPIADGQAVAASKTTPFALLKQLHVVPEMTTSAPKSFAAWGKPTVKTCKTLQAQVLAADATGATPRNCSAAGLSWSDPLTGTAVKDASKMTVVRLVPIEEAWDSGASRWDTKTRTAFANDLKYDGSLIAVSKSGASKRKDREPSAWMPSTKLRCDYATAWMSVKVRWNLTIDQAEYDALRSVMGLSKCAKRAVPVVKLADAPMPPTRYETCAAATTAGVGPYLRGRDPEYVWYRDDDGDGTTCEPAESMSLTPSNDWRAERLTNSTTPSISADVNASATPGRFHARILKDGVELWHGVTPDEIEPSATRSTLVVPDGKITSDGTYTAQTWTGPAGDNTAPAGARSMTFRLDRVAPSVPKCNGAAASSDAPDLMALWFSSWVDTSGPVPARPGEQKAWAPPYPAYGGSPVWVKAQDYAGNFSSSASYTAYPS